MLGGLIVAGWPAGTWWEATPEALCQRKTHARNDDNSAGPNTVEPDRASLKGLRSGSRSARPTLTLASGAPPVLSRGAGPPCAPAAG